MKNQKFRLSPKAVAWEYSIIFFILPFLVVGFIIGSAAIAINQESEDGSMQFILSIILSLPSLIIIIISFALVFVAIGRGIFSYLLLSDDGLEYRLWPLHRIRCSWDDVEQIKKSSFPFQGDILTLKKADVSGFHILLDFNKGNFGVTKAGRVIPLYQINGWPNGKFKDELRKYAPNLFVEQSES